MTSSPAQLSDAEPHFVAPELIRIDAKGQPRLTGGKCKSCGALNFPKRHVCAECLGVEIEDTDLASEGTLYSYSVVHQAPKGWDLPYVIGYVDLTDGIRVLAHIEGAPDTLRMDGKMRLGVGRVGSDEGGKEIMSYVFKPAEGATK